jgi:hypothetical protein
MKLEDLRFDKMAATWQATAGVADAWFPELSGSPDARLATIYGRELLRAFALLVQTQSPECSNMKFVRQVIMDAERSPESVRADVRSISCPEADRAVNAAFAVAGSWFVEPLKFLLLNITDERAGCAVARWP